jgi:hypothetical protein
VAAPVINSISPAGPLVFAPGETKQVRIDASDPDNGPPVSQRFVVSDTQGNQTPILLSLQVQDQLTFSADPAPAGWVVTQDANDKALFYIKAP